MHYLLVLLWAVANLCAYVGYGQVILCPTLGGLAPWPFAGCIGISSLIALGGFLNLVHGIIPPVLIVIVVFGCFLCLLAYRREWVNIYSTLQDFSRDISGSYWSSGIALLVLAFLAIAFFGNLVTSRFNPWDDLLGYVNYAVQTAQLGSLPSDPFGERRIISSLGSGYFLQAMILVIGDVRSIHIPDISFGYLLSSGSAYFIARKHLSRRISILIAFLIIFLCIDLFNATYYILPEALIFTLFWIASEESFLRKDEFIGFLLLGLVAGALATLKSNYVPFATLFCLFFCLTSLLFLPLQSFLLRVAACLSGVLFVMSPWMLDQYHKEGTWLFPIFGRGFDASAYPGFILPSGSDGLLSMHWAAWRVILPLTLLWSISLLYLLTVRKFRAYQYWPALVAMTSATCLSTILLSSASGGDSIGRYSGPFVVADIAVVIIAVALWISGRAQRSISLLGFAAISTLLLLYYVWHYDVQENGLKQYGYFVIHKSGLSQVTIDYEFDRKGARKLQNAIPADTRILVATKVSFAMNAHRNTLYVDDFLGTAGPHPGPPITADGEKLRRYLQSYNVRYIAYSRGYISPLSESDMPADAHIYIDWLKRIIANPSTEGSMVWLSMQHAEEGIQACQIRDLSNRYRLVYDDGTNIVIDLNERREKDR